MLFLLCLSIYEDRSCVRKESASCSNQLLWQMVGSPQAQADNHRGLRCSALLVLSQLATRIPCHQRLWSIWHAEGELADGVPSHLLVRTSKSNVVYRARHPHLCPSQLCCRRHGIARTACPEQELDPSSRGVAHSAGAWGRWAAAAVLCCWSGARFSLAHFGSTASLDSEKDSSNCR